MGHAEMTYYIPSITGSAVTTALGDFLTQFLPAGTVVVVGQDNEVAEPAGASFVVMTPISRDRLGGDIDAYQDCSFEGSIAATVLTVSTVLLGVLTPGNLVFGTSLVAGTTLGSQISGPPGGAGTYNIAPSQTVASEKMACGQETLAQTVEMVVQLDFHGADSLSSGDMAQTVSALFRDDIAAVFFADYPGIYPLHADEAHQAPFINAEQNYETRWVIDVHLQINPAVIVPQQFADQLHADLTDVDAEYPA
jgi:hypothetical protein